MAIRVRAGLHVQQFQRRRGSEDCVPREGQTRGESLVGDKIHV